MTNRPPHRPPQGPKPKIKPTLRITPAAKILPTPRAHALSMPRGWEIFFDREVTSYVKTEYSPDKRRAAQWKDKPFSEADLKFFARGVHELSSLFTDERPKKLPDYFAHPKFRSSYLLYFLPLQAAKVAALLAGQPKALDAMLESATARGVLKLIDLGCGPGTASFATLLTLLEHAEKNNQTLPPVELTWIDTSGSAIKDGLALIERFKTENPELRITVKTHAQPWWFVAKLAKGPFDLVLMAHTLNESGFDFSKSDRVKVWDWLLENASGAGLLLIDTASRVSSQLVGRLRDGLFDHEILERSPTRIWGPCLHAELCPLTGGRDWCHFSVRAEIPGQWFKAFSRSLGSERDWLKYSYFWIAAHDYPAPVPAPQLRRVVSDEMKEGKNSVALLCEPERTRKIMGLEARGLLRGQAINVS